MASVMLHRNSAALGQAGGGLIGRIGFAILPDANNGVIRMIVEDTGGGVPDGIKD